MQLENLLTCASVTKRQTAKCAAIICVQNIQRLLLFSKQQQMQVCTEIRYKSKIKNQNLNAAYNEHYYLIKYWSQTNNTLTLIGHVNNLVSADAGISP